MNYKAATLKWRFLLSFLLFALLSVGQKNKIPPFSIRKIDGKIFNAWELPKNKPVILIYFSPDCDHCKRMMTDLVKRSNDFKNTSITMITYLPVSEVSKFVKDYNISKYPFIYIGTESTTYFVRDYFNLVQMPFLALYNEKGEMVTHYEREIPFDEVVKQVKKLI